MKKFAVVLAGCGTFDGAEIQEAVLTLLAIQRNGGIYEIFAPDKLQHHVINHITGNEMPEKRNVLLESARIARGKIESLDKYNPDRFDALVFPGGFGVAKNLCNWAFRGPDCEIDPLVTRAVISSLEKGLAVGAMCIAPVIFAKILGDVVVTIGSDPKDAKMIEMTGSRHIATGHAEVVSDPKRKIFTTPCYMLDATIMDIFNGTDKLIKAMMESI